MNLKNIHVIKSKGKVYYYHRPTRTRIKAAFGTPEFIDELNQLNGRAPVLPRGGTLGALIAAYRQSPEYATLAPKTRETYEYVFKILTTLLALPLIDLNPARVIKIRDKVFGARGFAAANYTLRVLRLILNWGQPRGWLDSNPADKISAIRRPKDMPKKNRAWGPDEIEAVLNAAQPALRPAIALGAFAGLTLNDALRLPWSAYDGVSIKLDNGRGKTLVPVHLRAHARLRDILDATPRRATVIVTNIAGRPYTTTGFKTMFYRLISELVTEKKIQQGLTFHGLRHTVAKYLVDAGATVEDVKAVLGHRTSAMAAHYADEYDRKARASAAILRLEKAGKQNKKRGKL